MSISFIERELKKIKRGAISMEIIPPLIIVSLLYILDLTGYVTFFEHSCSSIKTLSLDLATIPAEICNINSWAKIIVYFLLPYLIFCAFLISSPLKASPVMWVRGLYLERQKDNEKPTVEEGFKWVFSDIFFIPLFFAILYFSYFDFSLNLHQLINGAILVSALSATLLLIDVFHKSNFVWGERASGLKVCFTARKKERLEKEFLRKDHWYYRPFYELQRYNIGFILGFVIWGFFAFNVLREGHPPPHYNEYLYERPAPQWTDNSYFALAGLNAPEDVKNFYLYGKEKTLSYARDDARVKKGLELPFTQVPDFQKTLYSKDHTTKLRFDDTHLQSWDCIYNLQVKNNLKSCPPYSDITQLIEDNSILWARFQIFPSYPHFSIPDLSLDALYNGSDLINLAELKAAHIIMLQSHGNKEQAMEEWIKYMRLYQDMAGVTSTVVETAISFILVRVQKNTLETLLFNDPTLAIDYGDKINRTLTINNLHDVRGGTLLADDWRVLEPLMMTMAGSVPLHKRKIYVCFQENEHYAQMSAHTYFSEKNRKICKNEYSNDPNTFILSSIKNPGNPITNIIYDLIIGGVLKTDELFKSAHYLVVDFQMTRTALHLLQKRIPAGEVSAYLETVPSNLQNPITHSPFLWDQDRQMLYYKNVDEPNLEPRHTFYVNL